MSTNMFLMLDGIAGESDDEKHPNWCEITAWDHSFTQPVNPMRASSGQTVEKCAHELLNVTKYIDCATPAILKAVWGGLQMNEGYIVCYRSDGNNVPVLYLQIIMTDVVISSYSIGGGEGDLPQENIGLSYSKVQYEYNEVDKLLGTGTGVIVANHDLIKNVVSDS